MNKAIFLFFLFLAAFLGGLLYVTLRAAEECEAKGGVYTRIGCVKKDAML